MSHRDGSHDSKRYIPSGRDVILVEMATLGVAVIVLLLHAS